MLANKTNCICNHLKNLEIAVQTLVYLGLLLKFSKHHNGYQLVSIFMYIPWIEDRDCIAFFCAIRLADPLSAHHKLVFFSNLI